MILIQAIMEKPRYIILDEPFDALDNKMKGTAKDLLEEAVREGATLIFTSYDPDAREFADVALQIENRGWSRDEQSICKEGGCPCIGHQQADSGSESLSE